MNKILSQATANPLRGWFAHHISLFFILLFFVLLLPVYATADKGKKLEFGALYVLGDSLSDTGNLGSISGDFPFPFFGNRASNGLLAVEVLAQRLELSLASSLHLVGPAVGTNYAVAQARSVGDSGIDLLDQVNFLLLNTGGILSETALYTIIIGGNDIRDARDSEELVTMIEIVSTAVGNIQQAIVTLKAAGAKHFLVSGPPDLALAPETLLLAASVDSQEPIVKSAIISRLMDKKLDAELKKIKRRDRDINIIKFNLMKANSDTIENAVALGFTNTEEACFSIVTFSFHPDCNFGLNFDDFIFFDELHPTARSHAIVGDLMYETLVKSNSRRHSGYKYYSR